MPDLMIASLFTAMLLIPCFAAFVGFTNTSE